MPPLVPLATIEAARQGDLDAFLILVRAYAPLAAAIALARTGRSEVADEVAQESLIDAWRLLPTLREPAAFGAWLRKVVVKQADRYTRRRREKVSLDDIVARSESDLEQDAMVRERRRQVRHAVTLLPPHLRETVALFYLSGCSHAEVADLLSVPLSTVKKRLHDARLQLALTLEEAVSEPVAPAVPLVVEAFVAARTGRTDALARALDACPELLSTQARPDPEQVAARYAPPGLGATLLHEAVAHGRVEAARLLLDRGAPVDARTPGGLTSLLYAAVLDRPEMVELLLDRGADPRCALANGATALHIAAHRHRDALVQRLVAAGLDPDARDARGQTAETWSRFPGHRRGGEPGRIIDPSGRALDGGAALALPERSAGPTDAGFRETGIKAVDLLAPLGRAGVHRLLAGAGVGKIVLVGELARVLGPVVVAALLDRAWDVRDFEPVLRELGAWERAVVVMGASLEDRRALATAALALAEARSGWVVADDRLEEELAALGPWVPVLSFSPHVHPETVPALGGALAQIVLDPARSKRGEWPALDLERCSSRARLDERHRQLTARLRQALAEGGPLAERLSAWLTQPFRCAEEWTGRPGEVVSLPDALDQMEALLDGRDPRSAEELRFAL